MTITQSLRDDNAASGSITDAIDKLAIAMGGGFRSASTRQNTDATGRIVQQTLFTEEGTAVSVKRSERNTGGGTKEGTGGPTAPSISYDGNYWLMNGSSGASELEFIFEADDDEKIVIRIANVNNTEATGAETIRITNVTLGGETTYSALSGDDYTFIGFPGQSYKVTFINGGASGAVANGTMTVDYMPELAQALRGDPFVGAWGVSGVPLYFAEHIPKLLPSATIQRTGGPAVFNTYFYFSFPAGLRPWFPFNQDFAYRVALVVKYVGIDISILPGITDIQVQMIGYEGVPGVGAVVDISDQWCGIVGSGLWPAIVVYFEIDADWENHFPCQIRIQITHGAGTYFPPVPTLGYFLVEGRI